jgi:hypothetical protein
MGWFIKLFHAMQKLRSAACPAMSSSGRFLAAISLRSSHKFPRIASRFPKLGLHRPPSEQNIEAWHL